MNQTDLLCIENVQVKESTNESGNVHLNKNIGFLPLAHQKKDMISGRGDLFLRIKLVGEEGEG